MNRDELNARRERLRAEVESLETNSEMTTAEKSAKYESLQAEVAAFETEQKNFLRNGEMLKALGDGGSGATADFGFGEDMGESIAPLSRRRGEIARAMMKHPMFLANKDRIVKGIDPDRSAYEVVTKDATAANNLIGEGLYGGTGPTAAGQAPFLPGAVGAGIQPDWLPGIVDLKYYPLRFSEILDSFATDAPNLSYLTEATSNRQAAATAEGGAFPYSSGTFSRVYEQVGKVSNAMVLTDETIEDAPMLRNFLQNSLLDGVVRQEDSQLLAGGGVPGVNGLLNRTTGFTKPNTFSAETNVVVPASSTPGLGSQTLTIASLTHGTEIAGTGTGVAPTAGQIAVGVFNVFAQIEYQTQFSATHVVMHPLDWATVRTGQDANGQFYGGDWFFGEYGNGRSAGQSLWGKPVVTTSAIPRGYILTGYFGPEAIRVARRRGIVFQQTNSDQDNFIHGKVTMRADSRLGLMVFRPSVFSLIKLVNGA